MVIVLVFFIFQFNLVFFCMLDEVDVFLDDVNVGCYVNMVKEMLKQVQFIYIIYNKIVMELGDQLMGVIMYEFGCLCLVFVDVEEVVVLVEV